MLVERRKRKGKRNVEIESFTLLYCISSFGIKHKTQRDTTLNNIRNIINSLNTIKL